MSEIILAAVALLYAGWIGHGIGHRSGVREGVKDLAGMIDPSHLEFAHASVECARKLHETRRLVGDGPQIWSEGIWRIDGLGHFKVRIEEQGNVDA